MLLIHLLKWQARPGPPSWRNTIDEQRRELEILLEQSPSLRRHAPEAVETRYRRAVEGASRQMRSKAGLLPERCPFTVEQVLDYGYPPE